jgi:hypothetical protein
MNLYKNVNFTRKIRIIVNHKGGMFAYVKSPW